MEAEVEVEGPVLAVTHFPKEVMRDRLEIEGSEEAEAVEYMAHPSQVMNMEEREAMEEIREEREAMEV